ncbi:MarR family transcriptional regulator [Amycolatopsis acidicola]|uniref:MarR family transcriptional regulator n=1 Tax=Amycolatopsis acidicola TaxID=2596893 RepID=A0A5N0UUT4_9PSEU|nr:MarR family transcriptional regulator [Amycolatopsis acidicola]KAA9155283.1 MarR family transcriptional regulator [Amycolatopsis acidicola]
MTTKRPTEEHRELAGVLRGLSWTIHRLVPETAGLEPLPNTELAALKQVLDTPGITVGELAGRLGMKQSNTSAAVRALTGRGLIAREGSPEDGRVTRLVPTEKSLADDELIDEVWSGTIRAAMARLEPAQIAAISSAADALKALDEVLHTEARKA